MSNRDAPSWREVDAVEPPKPSPRAVARLVVLAAVVVLLVASGRWRSPIGAIALVSALLVGQATVLWPTARSTMARVEEAIGSVVGTVLGWVLLAPLYYLVFAPVGLLLRVIGVRPLEHGVDRRGETLWVRAVTPPRVGTTRMFSDERAWKAPLRRRRARSTIVGTVVAVLLVEALVLGVVLVARRRLDPVPERVGLGGVSARESAALRDEPWTGQLLDELGDASQGLVYVPFVGQTLRDYHGTYVNVDDRVRRSYQPTIAPGVEPLDVWFFGGSTMFGYDAQRDLHTIPSAFARLAEAAGIPVQVRNYGSAGFVNYQEELLLSLLVTAGEQPDLVIFYDGINDFSLQLLNAVGGISPLGEPAELGAVEHRKALVDSGVVPGLQPGPPGPLTSGLRPPYSADDVVDAVSNVYSQGMELSDVLAERHGFDVMYFWQPTMYSKAQIDPGERELLPRLGLDPFRFSVMSALSDRVTAELPQGVIDVSDALDDTDGPVFSDNVHTNEVGASAVAAALFAEARPTLERLE